MVRGPSMRRKSRSGAGPRGNETVSPGAWARTTGRVALPVALALGALTAGLWWHERDLRDLDALVLAEAEIVDVDYKRRSADVLQLRFQVRGQSVEAGVPSDIDVEPGRRVEVAYVQDDPERVRTVQGWGPAYGYWGLYALMLAVGGLGLTLFGWASRRRPGAFEDSAPAPALHEEALGLRVVQGASWPAVGSLSLGALFSAVLVMKGLADPSDTEAWWAAATIFPLFAVMAWALHRYAGGSDGVWATDTELIARRKGSVRRWPWARVVELGTVTRGGSPVAAAARLEDGDNDGIGQDGWVAIARPAAGPFVGHRNHTRLRRLAEDHDLPYVDGLTDNDLADTVHGQLQYRLRSR